MFANFILLAYKEQDPGVLKKKGTPLGTLFPLECPGAPSLMHSTPIAQKGLHALQKRFIEQPICYVPPCIATISVGARDMAPLIVSCKLDWIGNTMIHYIMCVSYKLGWFIIEVNIIL